MDHTLHFYSEALPLLPQRFSTWQPEQEVENALLNADERFPDVLQTHPQTRHHSLTTPPPPPIPHSRSPHWPVLLTEHTGYFLPQGHWAEPALQESVPTLPLQEAALTPV